MTRVVIPRGLRAHCGGNPEIEVEAASVAGVLRAVEARFPGFSEELGESYAVSIDGEIFHDPLYEAVGPKSELHFLPALSGGR